MSYVGWVENPFLDHLELSVRADRVLRCQGGIDNLDAFLQLDRKTVTAMPGAGVKTWQEISELQAAFAAPPLPPRPTKEWSDEHKIRVLCTLIASTSTDQSVDSDLIHYWVSRTHEILEHL